MSHRSILYILSLSEPVDASLINDNGAMSSMQEDSLTSNENGSTDSVYSYENRVAMELVSSPGCVPFAKVSVPSGEWRDEPFSLQINPWHYCVWVWDKPQMFQMFY